MDLVCGHYRLESPDDQEVDFSFCLERDGRLRAVAHRDGDTLYSAWSGAYWSAGDRLYRAPEGAQLCYGPQIERVRNLLHEQGLLPEGGWAEMRAMLESPLESLRDRSVTVRLAGFDGPHPDHRGEVVEMYEGIRDLWATPDGREIFDVGDDPEMIRVARRVADGRVDPGPSPRWGTARITPLVDGSCVTSMTWVPARGLGELLTAPGPEDVDLAGAKEWARQYCRTAMIPAAGGELRRVPI